MTVCHHARSLRERGNPDAAPPVAVAAAGLAVPGAFRRHAAGGMPARTLEAAA
jgi:hypothetical protein